MALPGRSKDLDELLDILVEEFFARVQAEESRQHDAEIGSTSPREAQPARSEP